MLTFKIDEAEARKLGEWLPEHDKNCRHAGGKNSGAIGGRLSYLFTPTSIGVVVKVMCACGGECDITDYSQW
jgi:hypothetical protein